MLLPVAVAAHPGKEVADFFTDPLAPSADHLGPAVLALAITLAVSAFFYRFLEHPLETRIRRRLGRRQPEPAPPVHVQPLEPRLNTGS